MELEPQDKVMDMAIRYLGYRARTEKEMTEYLTRREVDEKVIAQVMEKLVFYDLINDAEYARRFVELHGDNDGRFRLRQKMKLKGLPENVIEDALSAMDRDDEIEAAKELLEKKLAHDDREDAVRRAVQSVMRKGFSYDVVKAAAEQYREQMEFDEE